MTKSDPERAVIRAADVVGHKYFAPQVFDRVRSPRYRSLLRTIPRAALSGRFKGSEILEVLSREERASLDNFLGRGVRLSGLRSSWVPSRGGGYGAVYDAI